MAHVLVLKATNPAGESSPEMRYLLSDLLLQARRAFGAATLHPVAGREDGEAVARALGEGGFSHALLLGPGDVLLRVPSLQRMRRAAETAEAGPVAAVARRVAETDLAGGADAYTLSDFERLEERYLARLDSAGPAGSEVRREKGSGETDGGETAAASPADLAPAALLTATDLSVLLREHTVADLVAGELEPSLPGRLRPVPAGLCHEFIDYYGEVRSDVAPFLPKGAGEVLEVGCGRGATGRYLQDELGCRVTGVELNPVVGREAADHLHRVVVGDVEDPATVAELEAGRESGDGFDALLALELFEHLVEPERFLDRIRPLLRPGGRIILSVPNVGHHSVVRDLMAGRWDYLPIGILCYTHYRFYTRRTLEDWLARCGFPGARLVAQRTPPPDWLAAAGGEGAEASGGEPAGIGLQLDEESLTTKGYYVLIDIPEEE